MNNKKVFIKTSEIRSSDYYCYKWGGTVILKRGGGGGGL